MPITRWIAPRGSESHKPTGAECDIDDGLVLDEHRDDDFAAGTEISDGGRNARAGFSERCRLRRNHVEDREFVSGSEDASRHPLTHATETDEADLHAETSDALICITCEDASLRHTEAVRH